jgi:hypothetical protein
MGRALGRTRSRLVLPAALLALAALVTGPVAHAQEGAAAAESLFEQGRQLLAEGKLQEACSKLAESQKLDPAVGTLLNLGDCYAKMGKTATAWAVFKLAEGTARSANQPSREKIAQARVAALEPSIPKLSIAVPHETTGLEVRRDGLIVGRAEWSSPIAIDPGEHEIGASAPGKKPWSSKVTLAPEGKTTNIEIPALLVDELGERAPVTPAPVVGAGATVEVVMAHDQNVQRAVGLILGGAGLVSMAVGIPFGARAITLNNESKPQCPTDTTCTAQGAADSQSAVSSGTIATVFMSAGSVVLVVGAIVYLTAPRQTRPASKASLHIAPQILARGSGLGLVGTW